MRARLTSVMLALAVSAGACSDKVTSPSDTTASPTTTENWSALVTVGGSTFYSFSVAKRGTVNLTLVSVIGTDVPEDVALALGIGSPVGTGCSANTPSAFSAGTSPQVTGTYEPGVYCAKVVDTGNLPAPATVSLVIAHP